MIFRKTAQSACLHPYLADNTFRSYQAWMAAWPGWRLLCGMNLDDLKSAVGVYVLLGSGGAYMYKGSAHDLRKRVADHMQGRVARTRTRQPLKLIHVEYIADYTEARRREN